VVTTPDGHTAIKLSICMPRSHTEGLQERLYLFFNMPPDRDEWQASHTHPLTPRKERQVPTKYEARWAPKLAWMFSRGVKSFVPGRI